MSLRKFVSHVTKEEHRKKSQCLWITIVFKWETPATNMTKYHIYSITIDKHFRRQNFLF